MVRTTYVRGPAKIAFNGVTFQSRGDIKVVWKEETFNVESDLYAVADRRAKERTAEITFTPLGSTIDWAAASILWPLSGLSEFVGQELFATYAAGVPTSVDLPLVITGRDSAVAGPLTFNSAAVTKMPDTIQSASATLVGPVTLTAIGIDNHTWAQANSLWTVGSPAAWSGPTAPTIVVQPYVVTWPISASAPWNATLETASGVKTTYDMQLEPWGNDTNGISGMTIKGLGVTSRMQIRNIAMADLLGVFEGLLQGPTNGGAYRGKSIGTGATLSAIGSGVAVRVYNACLQNPGLDWGASTARIPELEFVAVPAPGSPWFAVGTS